MTENFFLAIALLVIAAIFGMTGLRMWYIMHQDTKLGQRVNGLSIDMGKIKKALRDGIAPATTPTQLTQASTEIAGATQDLTLDQFVEAMGFDAKEINNPIVRPMAEKMFNAMKEKASTTDNGEEASANIEML